MNIVLLVNSYNLEDIRSFITAAAELQTTKANGALVVVYQKRLGEEAIKALAQPLLEKMSAGGSISAAINGDYSNDGRNASLFAFFISQGYARFPGPWLVVDGPGIPTKENFIQALERQHGGLGGTCSGRISPEGVAHVPIGPVVIGVPVSQLSWFTQGGRESWRATMRFMLARCGFKQVPLDEYLFSLPSAVQAAPMGVSEQTPAVSAPSPEPPVEPPVSSPPVFNPAVLDQPVAATQVSPEGDTVCTDTDTTCPNSDTICPDPVPASHSYGDLDRDALFALIESRGLEKPHHSTGKPKLIALLFEADAAPTHS